MKTLRRQITSNDGHIITQILKYDTHESAYNVSTVVNNINYKGHTSLGCIDVSKHKEVIKKEIEKAEDAIERSKPSESELLYDELGFKEI